MLACSPQKPGGGERGAGALRMGGQHDQPLLGQGTDPDGTPGAHGIGADEVGDALGVEEPFGQVHALAVLGAVDLDEIRLLLSHAISPGVL